MNAGFPWLQRSAAPGKAVMHHASTKTAAGPIADRVLNALLVLLLTGLLFAWPELVKLVPL